MQQTRPERNLVAAAGFLVLALTLSAAEGERGAATVEPWRVSWEDRMTLRFSAGEQDRRLKAYLEARSEPSDATTWPTEWHVVVGGRDPAALTPQELFRSLVGNAVTSAPKHRDFWRSLYESRISDPQVRDDFWPRLEAAIAPLLEINEVQQRLKLELDRSPPEDHARILAGMPDPRTSCALHADALAAARREFSAEGFDRVLYEAVAPNLTVSARINQADLEYVRGGCR